MITKELIQKAKALLEANDCPSERFYISATREQIKYVLGVDPKIFLLLRGGLSQSHRRKLVKQWTA